MRPPRRDFAPAALRLASAAFVTLHAALAGQTILVIGGSSWHRTRDGATSTCGGGRA